MEWFFYSQSTRMTCQKRSLKAPLFGTIWCSRGALDPDWSAAATSGKLTLLSSTEVSEGYSKPESPSQQLRKPHSCTKQERNCFTAWVGTHTSPAGNADQMLLGINMHSVGRVLHWMLIKIKYLSLHKFNHQYLAYIFQRSKLFILTICGKQQILNTIPLWSQAFKSRLHFKNKLPNKTI